MFPGGAITIADRPAPADRTELEERLFYAKLGYELLRSTVETPRGHRELTFQKQLDARA